MRDRRKHALIPILERQLAERRIDRREFLRRATRLGMAVSAAYALAGKVAGPSDVPDARAQTLSSPKKGGTIKVATKADFTSFDPIAASDYETWILILNVFDVIVNYDKDGKLYPVVAKEIPRVSNGGKTFEIKIREGAKFHNGRQIVADDIKYSLERVALKENKSWGIAYTGNVVGLKDYQEHKIKELPGIKVVDKMTVVIDLETPSANYFNFLTMSTNAPVPREEVEKLGPEWGRKVVGSGPFVFKEWTPGKKFSMVKNPDYWDKALPHAEAVEYDVGIDNSLQLLRVEKGELDLMDNQPPEAEIQGILTNPKWKGRFVRQEDMDWRGLVFNTEMEPFNDVRIRKAVCLALNYEKYLRLLGGLGTRARGILGRVNPGHDPSFQGWEYNPDGAKKLLAEAGLAKGFETELYIHAGRQYYVTLSPAVQQDLAAVGIKATLRPIPGAQYLATVRKPKTSPLAWAGAGASYPDPMDFLQINFTCVSKTLGNSYSFYCNRKYDDLLEASEREFDRQKRYALFHEAQRILVRDDAVVAPMWHTNLMGIHSERLKGFYIHPIMRWEYKSYWLE
jgi:peptide/nickel transport system substrate-binding protein